MKIDLNLLSIVSINLLLHISGKISGLCGLNVVTYGMSLVSVFLLSQVLKISGLFIDLILAILSLMSAGGYFCFNRNSLNSSSLLIKMFSSELSVLIS